MSCKLLVAMLAILAVFCELLMVLLVVLVVLDKLLAVIYRLFKMLIWIGKDCEVDKWLW